MHKMEMSDLDNFITKVKSNSNDQIKNKTVKEIKNKINTLSLVDTKYNNIISFCIKINSLYSAFNKHIIYPLSQITNPYDCLLTFSLICALLRAYFQNKYKISNIIMYWSYLYNSHTFSSKLIKASRLDNKYLKLINGANYVLHVHLLLMSYRKIMKV